MTSCRSRSWRSGGWTTRGAPPTRREFLPSAYRDLDELDGFLEHLAREVYDPDHRRLLDSFLADDAFRAELRLAPCTRSGHHAYLGGLLEHTVAVGTLAQETCVLHPRLNSDLLITAALLHDAGKTREFTLGRGDRARARRGGSSGTSRSVSSSSPSAVRAWPSSRPPRRSPSRTASSRTTERTACPARRFASAEALALYRINALDAGVKGALEQGLPQ